MIVSMSRLKIYHRHTIEVRMSMYVETRHYNILGFSHDSASETIKNLLKNSKTSTLRMRVMQIQQTQQCVVHFSCVG